MKVEHFAINVKDAAVAARWYAENLGMKIVRASDQSPYIHFLVGQEGGSMIELYSNPAAPVPDYAAMNPLVLHIAFSVEDIAGTHAALLEAGATAEGEVRQAANGDRLAMLRDPWGVPLQLAQRGQAKG